METGQCTLSNNTASTGALAYSLDLWTLPSTPGRANSGSGAPIGSTGCSDGWIPRPAPRPCAGACPCAAATADTRHAASSTHLRPLRLLRYVAFMSLSSRGFSVRTSTPAFLDTSDRPADWPESPGAVPECRLPPVADEGPRRPARAAR